MQKFFTGVAVMTNRRFIDGKEGERLHVIDPHGMRVAFKQESVSLFRIAQSFFSQFAFGDLRYQHADPERLASLHPNRIETCQPVALLTGFSRRLAA